MASAKFERRRFTSIRLPKVAGYNTAGLCRSQYRRDVANTMCTSMDRTGKCNINDDVGLTIE